MRLAQTLRLQGGTRVPEPRPLTDFCGVPVILFVVTKWMSKVRAIGSWDALCQRRLQRRSCFIPARIRRQAASARCRVIDISVAGARISLENPLYCGSVLGTDWTLELPTLDPVSVSVIWRGSNELGVRFNTGSRGRFKGSTERIAALVEQFPLDSHQSC